MRLNDLCPVNTNLVAARVFREYGSMYAAADSVRFPHQCIFANDLEVENFQKRLKAKSAIIGGMTIELQEAAMDALQKAITEAAAINLRITPLDGSIAAKRNYTDTVRIWSSRFLPALRHWVRKRKISAADALETRNLNIREQVERVMEFEASGFYFSTNFSKSIFLVTAPPGTSQHLSMLAFDVVEYADPEIRNILNKHGWFQTIRTDAPHFTYLGVDARELPSRGLRAILHNNHIFWVPNLK